MKQLFTMMKPFLPFKKSLFAISFCVLLLLFTTAFAFSQDTQAADPSSKRIDELQSTVEKLLEEINRIKQEQQAGKALQKEQGSTISDLAHQVKNVKEMETPPATSKKNNFHFGGYGEMHANFNLDKNTDLFDIHRLVLYLGYDFTDWIKFNTELEIEHGFVSDDADGEFVLEQAYIDFLLNEKVNIRAGRVLTPLGIINKRHEPPSFFGVERPSFAKYIIPSTWSSDGIGIYGSLTPSITYEAYVVGGLDGSKFNAKDGIRKGRIKERPSLHSPAFTARIDFHPFSDHLLEQNQLLRLGVSNYFGGIDNGNNGKNPGVDGDIQIYSADFEHSIMGFLDTRGAIAYEKIDGAREIGNNVASDIFGWYLESGYHFLPDSWKKGRLERADAVAFLRYDDFDTQYDMPSGLTADPKGDRDEWTFGINFYPVPSLAVKADFQMREDGAGNDENLINLGIGWQY
jgi:phosphate-selective porin O/P